MTTWRRQVFSRFCKVLLFTYVLIWPFSEEGQIYKSETNTEVGENATKYPESWSWNLYSTISGKVAMSGFATWRLRRWCWLPGWWCWCRLSEPNGFPYGLVKFYFPPFPFLHFWWVIVVGCINVWVLLQSETMIT